MAERIREFRRLAMSAKTAQVIVELGRRTDADHRAKCADIDGPCPHDGGNLAVADLIRNSIKIGQKRATLDLPDPYASDDFAMGIKVLHLFAERVKIFARREKQQTTTALERIAEEAIHYANRNPLEVIAEAAR